MTIQIKRVYEDTSKSDGYRVLVDRVWPRGVSKDKAALDDWCKDVAPSSDLRKWFGHDPQRWAGFCKAYRKELDHCDQSVIDELRNKARSNKGLTLLFGARDTEHNQAVALKAYLEEQ